MHHLRWSLRRDSTFSDVDIFHEYLQGSLPPVEKERQRGRPRQELLHSYSYSLANTISTTHELRQDWLSMNEEWEDLEIRAT